MAKKKTSQTTRAMPFKGAVLTIRDDGSLTKPDLIPCNTDDLIVWNVVNEFETALTVKVEGFKFRGGSSKKVIDFGKQEVKLGKKGSANADGQISGGVVHVVKKKDPPDRFKYKIRVTFANDDEDVYDPDLEVQPPPDRKNRIVRRSRRTKGAKKKGARKK